MNLTIIIVICVITLVLVVVLGLYLGKFINSWFFESPKTNECLPQPPDCSPQSPPITTTTDCVPLPTEDNCASLSTETVQKPLETTVIPSISTSLKAKFYDQCNYQGNVLELGIGSYNVSDMGVSNNRINAVQVPAGFIVTLFQHAGFNGQTTVLTSDQPCLETIGWNNMVSGIKITQASTPTLPTPTAKPLTPTVLTSPVTNRQPISNN